MSNRPTFGIDIESTGTDPATDRIVTLAVVSETYAQSIMVNPGRSIPAEATEIHGITDEMVANCEPFEAHASELSIVLRACNLVGFNLSNFDVPLLWEEFHRAGIEWDMSDVRIFDAGTLFKRREERTLAAACKFYLGWEMKDNHQAAADAMAALSVWNAQLDRYGLRGADRDTLAKESAYEEQRVDLAGKIIIGKDGRPAYGFGKSKGVAVMDDTGYALWMLRSDFSHNTKMHLRNILYGPPVEAEFETVADRSEPF
jgi:DNA polymerase III subunit epsilon